MTRSSPMTPEKARQVVEALLFAADQPLSAGRMAQALGQPYGAAEVRAFIRELNQEYSARGHAFEVAEVAGGFQLLSRPEFKPYIASLFRHRRQEKLSQPAVETLAIVAYRQPILRAQVDDIRGVQSGPLLRSLMERGLVKVVGRQNAPGRPMLYGTTRLFLQHFGLKSLRELPRVEELAPPQPAREEAP